MTALPFPWPPERAARRDVSSKLRLVADAYAVEHPYVIESAEASLDDALARLDTVVSPEWAA